MGKASWQKRDRARDAPPNGVVQLTHEPAVPLNWPEGHVGVQITDIEESECIAVTVHGVRHMLHSTTARELQKMLSERLDEWNQRTATSRSREGLPGV